MGWISQAEIVRRILDARMEYAATVRRCYACSLEKPLEEFVRSVRRPGGYDCICKPCKRVVTRRDRQEIRRAQIRRALGRAS